MNKASALVTLIALFGLIQAVHAGKFVSAKDPIPNQYIVIFQEKLAVDGAKDPNYPARNMRLRNRVRQDYRGRIDRDWTEAVNGALVTMAEEDARKLAGESDVVLVEENGNVYLSETQTAAPWHLDRIDQRSLPLNQAYSYSSTGAGVNVYVIDTGIRSSHMEFESENYPYTSRVKAGVSFINDGYGTNDCNGHGTHVAGIIGGLSSGVAKGVSLYPVRVFNCSGSASSYDIILSGINWVASNHVKPAVVNMSLNANARVSSLVSAVNNVIASQGVTFVVAAGNYSGDACYYSPADAANAITVAASTSADYSASYSNFGSCVDIFAPGDNIFSASNINDSAGAYKSGTSMAAPVIAGAVSLILSGGNKSPGEVWQSLKASASTNKIINPGGSPNLLAYVGATDVQLSISRTGSGVVTSNPVGISCGAACSAGFTSGTSVTLTATPDAGWQFSGWGGGACSGTGTCVVSLTAATTVTASFRPILTVTRSGNGTITSAPAGISCGATCSAGFASGTSVILTATPDAGWQFSGWGGGACSGTGTCVVSLTAATTVTASFRPILTVTRSGNGTITSTPAGISCGATCSAGFASGTSVTLTATPDAGWQFSGWGGACAGTGSCVVSLTTTTEVTAKFSGYLYGLAAQGYVGTDNQVQFGAFTISGAPRKVLIRGLGPALDQYVPDAIRNPKIALSLNGATTALEVNDDWADATNAGEIAALNHQPKNQTESAILRTLEPGIYNVHLSGSGGSTGIGMFQVYAVEGGGNGELKGLAAQGQVGTGNQVQFGAFTIAGAPRKVLIRGLGPALDGYVPSPLDNPRIALSLNGALTPLEVNDDWADAENAEEIAAFNHQPKNPTESAILRTLDPGIYNVHLSGSGGSSGIGMFQIYTVADP